MITKNKHSPATLYLLNARNINKMEQQRKSARLAFDKKKSSRSISQYQKWNGSKDNNSSLYQPSGRINSQMRKIVLSKNQFGVESVSIQRKLSSMIQIFNSKQRLCTLTQQKQQDNRKSQQTRSGQLSLLSLKDPNQKQKQKQAKSSRISHLRTQNMSNNNQNSIQLVLSKFQTKFKQYEKLSQDWKLKYSSRENDNLLDDLVRTFKEMFKQLNTQYSNETISNLKYFQHSLTCVSKQYEIQIALLKQELHKADNMNNIINNLIKSLNQKHLRGITCTKILQEIQKNGINFQQFIKSSSIYEEIIKINDRDLVSSQKLIKSLSQDECIIMQNNTRKIESSSDDEFYTQQKLDHVQNDSNWNNHFQDRQSIKGVLRYINNHNQNKQLSKNADLANSAKANRMDMKIQCLKSFEYNQKSGSKHKKVMSQR